MFDDEFMWIDWENNVINIICKQKFTHVSKKYIQKNTNWYLFFLV